MNRSAEQTNRTRTASRFTRFVCPALRFIPHEPRKKDTHSLNGNCLDQSIQGRGHDNVWVNPYRRGTVLTTPHVKGNKFDKMQNTKELMQCHFGINNRVALLTIHGYPWQREIRPGAREESLSPAGSNWVKHFKNYPYHWFLGNQQVVKLLLDNFR